MSTAIRISNHLIEDAKTASKIDHRSVTSQIEHWATIGKYTEDNLDMPYSLIKDILLGMEELKSSKNEYKIK